MMDSVTVFLVAVRESVGTKAATANHVWPITTPLPRFNPRSS